LNLRVYIYIIADSTDSTDSTANMDIDNIANIDTIDVRSLKKLRNRIDQVVKNRVDELTKQLFCKVEECGYTIECTMRNEVSILKGSYKPLFTISFFSNHYLHGGEKDSDGDVIPKEPFYVYERVCDCTNRLMRLNTVQHVAEFLTSKKIPSVEVSKKLEHMIALCNM
jgi:hypothetical protein